MLAAGRRLDPANPGHRRDRRRRGLPTRRWCPAIADASVAAVASGWLLPPGRPPAIDGPVFAPIDL
jgi:hypothetical protein